MRKITCPKGEVSTIRDLLLVTTTARNWEAEEEEGYSIPYKSLICDGGQEVSFNVVKTRWPGTLP